MGRCNKLLLRDTFGRSMIGHVVVAALQSKADDIVLVTGHQRQAIEQAARDAAGPGSRLRVIHCPRYEDGLSASLKSGIQAVEGASAALICLGDMPLVTSTILDSVMGAYDLARTERIVVPTCRGTRGNPVFWDKSYFALLQRLSGDQGARALLADHPAETVEVEVGDEAILRDFDTLDTIGADWFDPSD